MIRLFGDLVSVNSECATGMGNRTSGHCSPNWFSNRARFALKPGYSDSVWPEHARKGNTSVSVAACSLARAVGSATAQQSPLGGPTEEVKHLLGVYQASRVSFDGLTDP